MYVHGVKAGQHFLEPPWAYGDHGREPYGRIHRIPAPHPIPEAEHVGRIYAELRNAFRVAGHGDKMTRQGALVLELVQAPLRSEEHTSELQSLMRISYAVFCLKKKNIINRNRTY